EARENSQMKKITITYLSLLLILTSLFSTPVSVLANTEKEPENTELEVNEEAEEEESNTEEEIDTEEPLEEADNETEEAPEDEAETEGLDSEEAFILRLKNELDTDHNYKKDDVETAQLPSSVVVAEAVQGTVNPKGEDIAAYTIHTNGQVEFTFLEAVESVGAVD